MPWLMSLLDCSTLTYSPAKKNMLFISSVVAANKIAAAGKSPEERKKFRLDEYTLPDALKNGVVKLRILVDRGSIEVFLNEGETVLTHSVISELDNKSFTITGGDATIKSLEAHELKSSWDSK